MPEGSKYHNKFNFNKEVGSVNTGDTKIEGDQIGIQHNKVSEKPLAESAKEIQDLLNQFSQTYPNITEAKQQDFVDNWQQTIETYPITAEVDKENFVVKFNEKVRTNARIREVLLSGGIELIKILCPPLGIPIEMGKRWLETAKHNQ